MIKKLFSRAVVRTLLVGAMLLLSIINACGQVDIHKMDSTVDAVLKVHNVPPFTRKLLVAQAKFESGNYTNSLFRNHNNLYGMMHPRKRTTKSIGGKARAEGKAGYAKFRSVEDSVEDMLIYLWDKEQMPRYTSTKQYVHFLKTNKFFTASELHYLHGLEYYLKQL